PSGGDTPGPPAPPPRRGRPRRGEHRGPAGQRAPGAVAPVDAARRADRVPPLLVLVGDAERLPLPDPGGVFGLPGEQLALLGRAYPPDPGPLIGQPGGQRSLTLPDGVPAYGRD